MGTRNRKIAHLTSVHDPGDTRIVHRECATLAESGYEVVLVARAAERAMPPGVRHRQVPAPRNRFERFTCTLWHVYRAAIEEDADAYHLHDPELVGVGIALRLRGKRVVFDVHEDVPADIAMKPWIWAPLRPTVAAIAGAILRGVARAFSSIVTATPAIARSYAHVRPVLIQNYPRYAEMVTDTECAYDTRPPHVLYLGQITQLRGIIPMVEAMASAALPSGVRLVLVGSFEDEALERRVRALPGWQRTVALGQRSRSELPAILSGVRAGLLLFAPAPNHSEAQPNKLFEYMAAALPVVASRLIASCREVVESCDCGLLVDPREPEEIASAIAQLLSQPARARAMGERGRTAVLARYNWSIEAPKLLSLYMSTT